MTRYSKLHSDGYYIGDLNEIVIDSTKLDSMIDTVIKESENKNKNYQYRNNISGTEYNDCPHIIPADQVEERKQFIKDNNLSVWQQWYETGNLNPNIQNVLSYFRIIVNNFITKIYPELNSKNIKHQDSITLYENGDFIDPHRDGIPSGRLCVVLIYLSNIIDYNDGGGKLIISTENNKEEIIPVKGNYVILDFTNHNVNHAVEVVKNNFRRFCYLTFVFNTEKMKREIK